MGLCCSKRRPGVSAFAAARDDNGTEQNTALRSDCVFCRIRDGHCEPGSIVHETDRLVVFRDIRPSATSHLQIVPRQHIATLNDLKRSAEDHALVREMLETGREVLERLHPGAQLRFGFHRPPFNSVLHLHMHGLALPYLPGAPKWKYADLSPWWIPVEGALKKLDPHGTSA